MSSDNLLYNQVLAMMRQQQQRGENRLYLGGMLDNFALMGAGGTPGYYSGTSCPTTQPVIRSDLPSEIKPWNRYIDELRHEINEWHGDILK